ncbi:MAG: NfeD family protein [Solirubrobacterales bacterium]|nr:NfeD family protein [Solirubrobacterales bacterium]
MLLGSALWVIVSVVASAFALKRRALPPLPIATGAVLALIATLLGGGFLISVFVFGLVALIGRWVIRPAIRSQDQGETRARAGTGTLVGRPGVVVERIVNQEAVGCVRIDGEIWTARSWEDGIELDPGTRVHVVELRGATAVVSQ